MQEIHPCGTRPSSQGPSEHFTGRVRIDPLFRSPEPARATGASVTFEPGARTAWHRHPLGQCPPNERHWHGALPDTAMTHIAIQEALDGKAVEWMEKVPDAEYESEVDSRESQP